MNTVPNSQDRSLGVVMVFQIVSMAGVAFSEGSDLLNSFFLVFFIFSALLGPVLGLYLGSSDGKIGYQVAAHVFIVVGCCVVDFFVGDGLPVWLVALYAGMLSTVALWVHATYSKSTTNIANNPPRASDEETLIYRQTTTTTTTSSTEPTVAQDMTTPLLLAEAKACTCSSKGKHLAVETTPENTTTTVTTVITEEMLAPVFQSSKNPV